MVDIRYNLDTYFNIFLCHLSFLAKKNSYLHEASCYLNPGVPHGVFQEPLVSADPV